MSRAPLDYAAPRPKLGLRFTGHDADNPVAGHYRMRLRSGGVYVGIRIWFGTPLDPIDGTELDRSPRWQAQANGRPIDLERVWPKCAADRIDAVEHAYLATLQDWGEAHAPDGPQANPHRPVDLLTAPITI